MLEAPLLKVEDMVALRNGKVCSPAVSFSLFPQQILRIVGANGSGKTSILLCLAGLAYLQQGSITINDDGHTGCRGLQRQTFLGRDETVSSFTRDIIQNRIAYLHAEQTIQAHLSVREDLTLWHALAQKEVLLLAADPAQHPFPPLARSVAAALLRGKLDSIADTPVFELSSGQKKRLALARMCLKPARIWLLDEPTNHLDAQGIDILAEMIKAFVHNGGSVIYTAPLTNQALAPLDINGITADVDYLLNSHPL